VTGWDDFRGKAADPLNQMDQFPGLYAFVYRLKSLKTLRLSRSMLWEKDPFRRLARKPTRQSAHGNLFIYATLKLAGWVSRWTIWAYTKGLSLPG